MNALTVMYELDKPSFHHLRREYQKRVRTFPKTLEPIPQDEFDAAVADKSRNNPPRKVWRSRDFLAQLFKQGNHYRLSVNHTQIDATGQWVGDITWDELMKCKRQCGYSECWAVEIYPPDEHLVNVANIRHLWLVEQPSYAWTKP